MNKPYWQGVFPAITTQFKYDQSIDLEATARHAEVLIDSGVVGLPPAKAVAKRYRRLLHQQPQKLNAQRATLIFFMLQRSKVKGFSKTVIHLVRPEMAGTLGYAECPQDNGC